MSSLTKDLINQKVLVITTEGMTLVGNLLSCDQVTNLVLSNTVERVISPHSESEPSSETTQGVYLVRGDTVVMIGLVNEELDASIDWTKVRGEHIGSTRHA